MSKMNVVDNNSVTKNVFSMIIWSWQSWQKFAENVIFYCFWMKTKSAWKLSARTHNSKFHRDSKRFWGTENSILPPCFTLRRSDGKNKHIGNKWPRWRCGLRRRCAAARLLRKPVRIPLRTWIMVSCACCVLCIEWPLKRADHVKRACVCACVCVWDREFKLCVIYKPQKRGSLGRSCGLLATE